MREKMPETDLIEESTKSATEAYGKTKEYDVVQLSMVVNAHSHGFYMAHRYWESVTEKIQTPLLLASEAANQYIKKTYPSLSREDEIVIRAALSRGFLLGLKHGHA